MRKKYNKYQSATKEERIKLLKGSIKKLSRLKQYDLIVKGYKKQLRKLRNENL